MASEHVEVVETEVLVVGGGPIGLSLANELGFRRVPCLLIEQGDGSVLFPAGEHIFSRTMEHLRRWGIAQQARSGDWPPPDYRLNFVFMTNASGHVLACFDNPSNAEMPLVHAAASPEGPMFCAKFRFDPLLRTQAASWPSVKMRYGCRLETLEQDDAGVTAIARDAVTGERLQIRAEYLAACDGGHSTVRRQLGIRFEGAFAQGNNYAIYFRAPKLLPLLQERGIGTVAQVQTLSSPNRPYITVVDGRERWRLSAYVEQVPSPTEAVQYIHEAVGTDLDVEVLRAQPWNGHTVVAERYREGRIFLVGDAAHLLWPKGGFGANTGIGDAVDLGWKLAAVRDGWASPDLLDSYEIERRPIAARNVREAASNREADGLLPVGRNLDEASPLGEAARAEAAEMIVRLRTKEYRTMGLQLGYRYSWSPICCPDGSAEPPHDPTEYVPSTWPGCRAPHAWLADGSSMLDHYGDGFVLVASGEADGVETFERAASLRGVPLSVLRMDSPAIALVYERPLVLVRPDGHVAWRGSAAPADLSAVLDRVCGIKSRGSLLREPLSRSSDDRGWWR